LLNFLGVEDTPEDFAKDVKIVLASADFDKEIITTVMWLQEYDLDIRCVRLKPYKFRDSVLVDVQTIIPLQETKDYQVRIRTKSREEREALTGKNNST
jgi:aromatic ring-opening dioxygenase LigB subunit